ncbi:MULTISPECIES: hypothetical protein [unclassified Streptomyces]|uniref:hypothetical protein n=1 Tax=unclassified Streptomyces TaxID=2593676 RepID=UPI0037B92927
MTWTPNEKTPAPGVAQDAEGAERIEAAAPAAAPGTVPGKEPGSAESGPHPGRPLFAPEEREAFAARIQQAVTSFVEDPHRAVREADATFDEVVVGLGAALEERGRRLRAGKGESPSPTGAETEDLRIALQHYRDLTERLVRL